MSIREQIRVNIITVLGTISTGSGYNFTIGSVGKQLKDFDNIKSDDLPAVFVINADEKKDDADVNELSNTLTVAVYLVVKNKTDAPGDLDNLLEDVEKAVCLDRYRGLPNLVVNTRPAKIETDKGSVPPFGFAEIDFEVEYFQPYGAP